MKLGLMLQVGTGGLADGRTPRWSDIREMAQVAEGIGFDVLFVPDHLLYRKSPSDNTILVEMPAGETSGTWEAWTVLAALAEADAAHRAGPSRCLQQFPQPRPAREDGDHPGRGERRPLRARHRRGLARAGVPRVRLPFRPEGGAAGGSAADHLRAAPKGARGLRGEFLLGPRLRVDATRTAPGGAADSGRRPAAQDVAPRGNLRGHLRRRPPPSIRRRWQSASKPSTRPVARPAETAERSREARGR